MGLQRLKHCRNSKCFARRFQNEIYLIKSLIIPLTSIADSDIIWPAVKNDSLTKQLEQTRFDRALEVTDSLVKHQALLTTAELARLNQILIGKNTDPWRYQSTTVQLASGRKLTLALIVDPIRTMREKLHGATEKAENGAVLDAAIDIYLALMGMRVFLSANRNSAVLASHYFLKRYGLLMTGRDIDQLVGTADLQQEEEIQNFRQSVYQMARFSEKRQPKRID